MEGHVYLGVRGRRVERERESAHISQPVHMHVRGGQGITCELIAELSSVGPGMELGLSCLWQCLL